MSSMAPQSPSKEVKLKGHLLLLLLLLESATINSVAAFHTSSSAALIVTRNQRTTLLSSASHDGVEGFGAGVNYLDKNQVCTFIIVVYNSDAITPSSFTYSTLCDMVSTSSFNFARITSTNTTNPIFCFLSPAYFLN